MTEKKHNILNITNLHSMLQRMDRGELSDAEVHNLYHILMRVACMTFRQNVKNIGDILFTQGNDTRQWVEVDNDTKFLISGKFDIPVPNINIKIDLKLELFHFSSEEIS